MKFVQKVAPIRELLIISFAFNIFVRAHTSLGEHGLMNAEPSADPQPLFSEISGFFEVEIDVRIDTSDAIIQNIFSWYSETSVGGQPITSDVVALRYTHFNATDQELSLWIGNGQSTYSVSDPCVFVWTGINFVSRAKSTLTFGVRTDGFGGSLLYMRQDSGIEATQPSGASCIPDNASRNSKLLTENRAVFGNSLPFAGASTGFRLSNLNQQSRDIADELRHQSLPGQTFAHGFVVSFHVRLDDLTKSNQTIFEFSNGSADNRIWFGQDGSGTRSRVKLITDGQTHTTSMWDGFEEGVWGLWHCYIYASGQIWIHRTDPDGSQVGQQRKAATPPIIPKNEFRSVLNVGGPNDPGDDILRGAVVGLRVDIMSTS